MKNKITLSGFAGTGKSTVGRLLQKKINFEFISVGEYSRNFAKSEYGMTINDFQEECIKKPKLDLEIDAKFRDECNSKSDIVIDYRLGFKFIKNSFNVLLKVSDEIAALRISKASRVDEDTDSTNIKKRNLQMKERFLSKYNCDFTNEQNYHLVIDTNQYSPEEVASLIIKKFNNN